MFAEAGDGRRIFKAGAVLIALLCLCLALDFFLLAPGMPSFRDVRERYRSSESFLYDRNGELIHVLRTDAAGRKLSWVSLGDISPVMKRCVVQAEDRRFYRHHGIDWKALSSAVYGRISLSGHRGASTITMQLASQLDRDLHPRKVRRTWLQKWRQMKAAHAVERSWTKEGILEAYLNLITFSGELQGIASASRGMFDKEPSGLNADESLVLAALIPSSQASPALIVKKACALGSGMSIPYSPEAISLIVQARVGKPYAIRPQAALAPHVARMLLGRGSAKVSCTLDRRLQEYASETLSRMVSDLKGSNVNDGAVLVADNATGEILAYVGNTGHSSSARYVDGVTALRQAGSTLKPFLYGLAIEKGILTASSIVMDSPLKVMTSTGLYQPEDYSGAYLGPVSVRTALASSLNTPAVRTLMLFGCGSFVEKLKELGFESIREDPEYYGYSLALGTVDISLYELVQAYMALADGGVFHPLRLASGSTGEQRQAMSSQAAFIVSSILSDRESRSATFGLENFLSTRFWTAAKTGTSKDMRDNWCVGYSGRYTVGVWVGNFSGEPMWNVTGITGAAPIWMEMMNRLHAAVPSFPPKVPSGVVQRKVSFTIGEQPRKEWYISETEPDRPVSLALQHGRRKISYPPDGATIALDPDIPEVNQAVCFQADPPSREYRWILNGKLVGTGRQVLWQPASGNYTLSLTGSASTVYDKVTFSVK